MNDLLLGAQTTFRKDRIMGWKELWQRWRNRPATSRRARLQPRQQRARLAVEQLEDRLVPAVATVQALVDAINADNAAPGAHLIELAPGTTFTLTAVDNNTDGGNGLPVIVAGDNLTIVGHGDTIERSKATSTPAFRLFEAAAGASLTLSDLTLQGGLASGAGGAIISYGGLSLTQVTVQNNLARGPDGTTNRYGDGGSGGSAYGGGVYIGGGTALLTGVTLSG